MKDNGNKIYPPLYLTPIEYEIDGKIILYIRVPVNPGVCRCGGKIFDRNHEADIDITNNENLVYQLYARKQDTYYVNKVFTAFSMKDLRHDLIERARNMTKARTQNHPWRMMNDEELLRSAGLILQDLASGKEGITLAAILLFGTDQLIMSVLAHHKTDAIFRIFNTDRYDDRDVIITNLLAHRDFSNAYVAKLVIERDVIFTENSNRSHGYGSLKLETFEPFPKNPPISKVFREIGLADELGSGMRNTYKYTKMYSGGEPTFIEGDVFRTRIPLSLAATATSGPTPFVLSDGVSDGVSDGADITIKLDAVKLGALLDYCTEERTKGEMMAQCNIKSDSYFRIHVLKPLLMAGLIRRTVPDKPNSPKQKYIKS